MKMFIVSQKRVKIILFPRKFSLSSRMIDNEMSIVMKLLLGVLLFEVKHYIA